MDRTRVRVDDGVELAVESVGSGPPLLLVHGFGGAKEDFADHVDALAQTHRVVVFDHRGHGASDAPDDERAYSLDCMATDTIQVVDALGIDTFTLLGHSMGGMVARRLVLAHPERVDAIVFMDTSAGRVPGVDPELVDFGVAIGRQDGKEALKTALDSAAVLETPAYQRLLSERAGYCEFVDRKWSDLSVVMWCAMATEIAHQPEQLAELSSLRMPTLVMVGELDESFVEPSRAIASTISGAVLVEIPDAGHSPQFEAPALWFDALSTFLRTPAVATRD